MPDINPQVILIFLVMIFGGLKALIEKIQARKNPPLEEDHYEEDIYQELQEQYLDQQRLEREQAWLEEQAKLEATQPPPLPAVEAESPLVAPSVEAKVKTPKLSAAEKEALDRFERLSSEGPRRRKTHLTTKSRLKQHLSSPTAAREALLLSEVLGPPKSLQ